MSEFEKVKVAIYCRLSQEDRNKISINDDSNSILNQKAMLLQYALEKNWEVYSIYSDDDYTGSDRNRPAFNRLLSDAKNHKFDIILCKSQSRFTREIEIVEKYIHGLFPLWGIRFVSVVDNADTDNLSNKKSRQINGLVNEWYLEELSNNIKSVLTSRRRQGYHIGSFALYGYKKDPDNKGHLIVDEEAASVVREIFTLFASGVGKTKIARILNERHIPNPTEYKRLHGYKYRQSHKKCSTFWKYYSVDEILKREEYIGNLIQGKCGSVSYKIKKNRSKPKSEWIRVEGTHDAIIDMELWNKVQTLIKEKRKPFGNGRISPLIGKVRCMYCGYHLRSTQSHNRHYLQCESRYFLQEACKGAFIPLIQLENIVIKEINEMNKTYLDEEILCTQVMFNDVLDIKKRNLEENLDVYRQRIEDINKCLKELYFDKVKKNIKESEYMSLAEEFKKEKKKIEKYVLEINENIKNIEKKLMYGNNKSKIIQDYLKVEKLDMNIVDNLIDCILVGRKNVETNEVPVEIHWNF